VNKRKYTTNIHANRLRMMLRRRGYPILYPASKDFSPGDPPQELWAGEPGDTCEICRTFVGLVKGGCTCPCLSLGGELAMKRTERALRRHYGTSNAKNY
jgi:hypothetical protein